MRNLNTQHQIRVHVGFGSIRNSGIAMGEVVRGILAPLSERVYLGSLASEPAAATKAKPTFRPSMPGQLSLADSWADIGRHAFGTCRHHQRPSVSTRQGTIG